MKKLTLLIACVFSSFTAHSASVFWTAGIDTGFADSTGAALTQGNYVRLGYFTISDSAIQALAAPTLSNVAALDASFVQFGLARVGDVYGVDGFFDAPSPSSTTFSYASNPTFDFTKQIYLWTLKATDNTTLGSALGSVSEHAIFYEPLALNAQWQFPSSDIATPKSVDIAQAKSSLGGVYLAGSHQASNAALTTINGGTPSGAVQLQGVPEPSSALLIAAGMIGLISRRRRVSRVS